MKKNIDWIKVSTLLSTLATLILLAFTYMQVTRYREANKADFAHKLKTDFFNISQRNLLFLLNNDLLEFKEVQVKDKNIYYSYFAVNKERAAYFQNDSIKLLTSIKDSYSNYDIEDVLLNHFEDLNMYRKKGLIDDDYIYNGFGWYIYAVCENTEIKKFLTSLKVGNTENDAYQGVKELYEFVQEYEKKIDEK